MDSSFDQDLFAIIWGPTVAALSYVYDNALEKNVVQKAISGFRSVYYFVSFVLLDITKVLFVTLANFLEICLKIWLFDKLHERLPTI